MGGAVSSGRDNNELVDNLMSGNYIRSRVVERVFRVLDRADYMSAEARDQAYKDLAWRNGPLHLSAPCIYSEVMEALELKPGLSFLNVGSGTGYLSTLVGLVIGSAGVSHGVEALPVVYEYASKKLNQFIENSVTLDEFDFCSPKYYKGNGLCLAPTHTYDRVYCGAGVLTKHENYFKQLTKIGGVLVMPLADTLVQLRRVSELHWTKRNLLNVSFALLREPTQKELDDLVKLEEPCPSSLQILSRAAIRSAMRAGLLRRHPELVEPPPTAPPAPRLGPRRICIPYDAVGDDELNELHDLDEAGGAHEMNALLSLVLSMGQNRAAGSLRLDTAHSPNGVNEPYAQVDVYSDEAEENEEEGEYLEEDSIPEDGVIVFDVASGSMRPRRGHPRHPHRHRHRHSHRHRHPHRRRHSPRDPAGSSTSDDRPLPLTQTKDNRDDETNRLLTEPCTETIVEASANIDTSQNGETSTKSSANGETSGTSTAKPDTSAKSGPNVSSDTNGKPKFSRKSPRRSNRRSGHLARTLWIEPHSDDEEAPQMNDSKRQKLDSGIGEGTASSGTSPNKSDHSSPSKSGDDQDTDMPWCISESEDTTSSTSSSESSSPGDSDSEPGGDEAETKDGDGENAPVLIELKRKKLDSGIGGETKEKKTSACGESSKESHEGRRRVHKRSRARNGCLGGGCRGVFSSGSDSGAESARGGERGPGRGRDWRRVQLSLAMKRGVKELPLPHALKKFINYERCYQF